MLQEIISKSESVLVCLSEIKHANELLVDLKM